MVLVKWKGYSVPTWENLKDMEDTEALDRFEMKWGSAKINDGPVRLGKRKS